MSNTQITPYKWASGPSRFLGEDGEGQVATELEGRDNRMKNITEWTCDIGELQDRFRNQARKHY